MNIVPALIPQSRHHLDCMLDTITVFCDHVQIDIVDGLFVPEVSWPFTAGSSIEEELLRVDFSQMVVEFDLMIRDPEQTLSLWQKTGAERIVVHVESTKRLDLVLTHHAQNFYQLGLAFNNETDVSLLSEIDISLVDYVQLMGISAIGAQGRGFDQRVLDRIRYVKKRFPDLPVSVDGSVNQQTLPKLLAAGAERFAVGSAILRAPDPKVAYKELQRILSR